MNSDDARRTGFRVTPQVVLGLVIVAFGLILTADNLRWIEAGDILRYWWPTIILTFGLTKLVQCQTRSGRIFGGLITIVGVWLFAETMFVIRFRIWDWWPLLLVGLGVSMMLRARGPERDVTPSADGSLSEVAVWSGLQRKNSSSAFRRADVTAIMGGVELDLRQASTATGEAVIDVSVMMGGVEIRVPPDWAVSNQVLAIMGGSVDKSSGTQAAKHRLIVRGFVIMGGIEIKT